MGRCVERMTYIHSTKVKVKLRGVLATVLLVQLGVLKLFWNKCSPEQDDVCAWIISLVKKLRSYRSTGCNPACLVCYWALFEEISKWFYTTVHINEKRISKVKVTLRGQLATVLLERNVTVTWLWLERFQIYLAQMFPFHDTVCRMNAQTTNCTLVMQWLLLIWLSSNVYLDKTACHIRQLKDQGYTLSFNGQAVDL